MKIEIYTTRICPYCVRAKRVLESKGVEYVEYKVDFEPELRHEMMTRSGRHTVPQIWIGDYHVGGCDDLMGLEYQHKLDDLLAPFQSSASQ